jgi:putative ABC transport system permease protein
VSGWLRESWHRVLSLFRRRRLESELDAELLTHVEMATDENLARGMAPAEARRRAMVALGGLEVAKETHRDARGLPTLESVLQDVRYAVRTLRRSPGFTLLAVTILALGIGTNTAIFSLVSAVLLRPLPFPQPDRLALLWTDFSARRGPSHVEATPADFVDWRERSRSFEDMAAFVTDTYNLTGSGDPEKLSGVRATANLFSVLGMHAIVGRTLEPYDEEPAAGPVVVMNERLWRSRFGDDLSLIGRSIVLNGLAHTVVGVVPSDFQFPNRDAALWVPARFTSAELAQQGSYYMYAVARLRADVTMGQAQAEMTTIAQRLADERPHTNADVGVSVTPAHQHLTRDIRPALLVLLGAVGLVLLIACATVANLLLVRGAGRRRELALRKAIGAAQARVVRQLLTESAVLAGLGTAFGMALSVVSYAYLARLVPIGLPQGARPSLDPRVLVFTAVVALVVVLGSGAGPAFAASRGGLSASLRTGCRTAIPGSRRLRNTLVVAEMTLTVVLLVGAGLLVRSYANVLAVDLGFEPNNLLVAETILPPSQYATFESRTAFYQGVLERVSALPGVTSAGYANYPPLVFKGGRAYVTIDGRPEPTPEDFERHVVSDRVISTGYLEALRVPLISGRQLDERDGSEAPFSVVINRSMANLHWPDQDPLGDRIKLGAATSPGRWFTVIGVVGDIRQMGLEVAAEPELYFSLGQFATERTFFWPQHLLVRSERDAAALASDVRRAVWDVDPNQPVANLRSMSEVVEAELVNRSTQITLVGAFALLALVMASVGLYGVLAFTVAQRTPEIGLRMALGARRAAEVGRTVAGALLLAVISLVLGLAGAFALTRLLRSLLFSVSPTDPGSFLAASLVVILVTVLASYVPARRAASVDPASTLRLD